MYAASSLCRPHTFVARELVVQGGETENVESRYLENAI